MIIVTAGIAGVAVLVGLIGFDETDAYVERRAETGNAASSAAAPTGGEEMQFMLMAGRMACLNDGGSAAQCSCLVDEIAAFMGSFEAKVAMYAGSMGQELLEERGNQARAKCGLPPRQPDNRVRTFREVQDELEGKRN